MFQSHWQNMANMAHSPSKACPEMGIQGTKEKQLDHLLLFGASMAAQRTKSCHEILR